jgi:septum site-determining protein MinC
MADTGIELKGSTFTLSVLHLTDTDPQQIRELLEAKVAQAPQFFNFAPLVVNVERLEQTPDFDALKETIEREDFVLVGVSGARDEATKVAAKAAGLAVMTAGKVVTTPTPGPVIENPKTDEPPITSTRVHHGNVRSGQQIYAAGGSLVIIGTVGNGAEVIADDSIHIYGSLRGRALAGARGNTQARIYCQGLDPELVSIAGTYQLSDALPAEMTEQDVHIRLEQDKLIFEKLQS